MKSTRCCSSSVYLSALPVFLMLLLQVTSCLPGYAQTAQVSGTVTGSDDGQPLPGVSVVVKGTNTGTSTDVDGHFTLRNVSPDAVIQFSFIGYQTIEMPLNGQSSLNVTLEQDLANLEEVVVTALGIEKEKKALGYAVQEVSGEGLVKAREPNVMSSLTGKVAGLNVQNSTDLFQDPVISLRGQKPLIVIDGIPDRTADLWKINPDDVENVNVLKGSTASALYGSVGRGGAIMITTRRGQSKEVTVEANSSTMFQPGFIRIPDVQRVYGAGDNGSYAYVNGSGSGAEGAGWIWGPKLDQPDPSTPSGFWETPQFNSSVDPETGDLTPLPWISRGADNVKNFFRTGLLSSNNLSISWGGEKGMFRASASHIYQKGIVPNTNLNNTSFSLSGNFDVSESLNTDARVTYNRQYTDNFPEVGYGPNNYLYNLVLWTGPDVDVRDLRNYWMPEQEGVQQRHYNQSWYNNPYFQAYEFLRGYYKDNIFGSLNMTYTILPSLSANLRTGMNVHGLSRSTKEPKSYIRYDVYSNGNYYLENENYFDIMTDLTLRYERSLDENISIQVEAGGSNFYNSSRWQAMNTDGLSVPGFFHIGNSTNPLQGDNRLQETRINSVYGYIDLEFWNMLYLNLTARNDWVSTLPVKNNSFFYPSVSASAALSEVLDLPVWFSFAKLRGSWSRVSDGKIVLPGDDPDNPYAYNQIPAYERGTKWNNIPSLSSPATRLNPDLLPETSDSWEAGIDLRFFGNRIGLDVTYFEARDYNNIVEIPVSISSGYGNRLENGHEYKRKGIEFMLRANPLRSDRFRWDLNLNLSQTREYLRKISGGAGRLNNLYEGDRADLIYASVYAADPQGRTVLGNNGFPLWDPYMRPIGNGEPDWVYGISNSFSYKNISLSFQFDGRLGGLMYSITNQRMWWGGTHPGTVNSYRDDANEGNSTYVDEGVVVTGGEATYDSDGNMIEDTRTFAPNETPVNYIAFMKETSNQHHYNYHYYKQTFMKLREITLGYNLPSKWLEDLSVQAVSISFVGRNLFLWTELPNVDPDPGADNLQTPSTRSFGINLDVKF